MAVRHGATRAVLVGGLVLAASPACVSGERSEEFCDPQNRAEGPQPALLLDLAWDTQPAPDVFSGGTCELASVGNMRWELVDRAGESWAHGESACTENLDLCDLPAGDYELQVEADDAGGDPGWASRCTHLQLVRFDTLYRCNIASSEQVAP